MTIEKINATLETRGCDFRLAEQHVAKPNDHYDGIVLRPARNVSRAVCPTLHADIIDRFTDIDECITFLTRQYENVPPFALDFLNCTEDETYRLIRPRIFPVGKITDYTDCGIYAEEYNGFGLSYFIDLGENSTVNLTVDLIRIKNINVDRLRTEAFANLAGMFKFVNMNAMFSELVGSDMPDNVSAEPSPLYVLTTKDGFEGSATIFCREAMQAVEKVLGNCFYVLPSSRHEVICLGDGIGDAEALTAMVREVNETQVEESDILGWSALRYENGTIAVVA